VSKSKSVTVEAKALFEKYKMLDYGAQKNVRVVIAQHTEEMARNARGLLGRRVLKKGKEVIGRSRPGQPPRSDSGKYLSSIRTKISPKGWVGAVSTSNVAVDRQGRRYPWMVESGTKTAKRRPLFKKIKRDQVKAYRRAILGAMRESVAKAQR
jgi:hypothetical protein